MHKILRRQDITFEDKDQALRQDVRVLGSMVGVLLKEQGGDALFEFVETARQRAIRRREGNEKPGEDLAGLVKNLRLDLAIEVIRAFSTYFQMVNTAEKVHRIRRRLVYMQSEGNFQPGGLEETLVKLKAAGLTLPALQELLSSISIEPVFTAHPTEPTRRTILRKEQHIVRRLIDMLNPTMSAQERNACLENIKLEMTTGWQTAEHPTEQMTVADELEHVLFFVTDVLYRAMPPFYEDLENAADQDLWRGSARSQNSVAGPVRVLGGRRHGRQPQRQCQDHTLDARTPALARTRSLFPRVRACSLQRSASRPGASISMRRYCKESKSIAASFVTPTTRCPQGTGTCHTVCCCA